MISELFSELCKSTWMVWVSLAPSLTFGALIAGILHVALPPQLISRALSGRGGVARAVFIGIPLPLCSCGVIPAGLGLHRDGASKGATVGFLISTPQTGVDSALVSASLLGLPFAIYKVIVAVLTGLIGGGITERLESSLESQTDTLPQITHQKVTSENSSSRTRRALEHGASILESIWGWVLVGVLASAIIDAALPPSLLAELSNGTSGTLSLTYLFALLLSLPLYVCATASVPIAATLVAKGMPIGVALVFLMAGPATNLATLGAIYRNLGRRTLVTYLITLIIGSLGFAYLLDAVLGWQAPVDLHAMLHEHQPAWWEWTLSVGLGIWMLWRLGHWLWALVSPILKKRTLAHSEEGVNQMLELRVSGLTCQGCARRLKSALNTRNDIIECTVNDELNLLSVQGSLSIQILAKAVKEIGFIPHLETSSLNHDESISTDKVKPTCSKSQSIATPMSVSE